jgi:Mrp family chromosome partitioning ATPase
VRTISFYSYKGGTGRTLLVANLAVYAARLGQTVAMVDLDLEAPGLAYKFLPSPHPNLVSWNGFQEIRDHHRRHGSPTPGASPVQPRRQFMVDRRRAAAIDVIPA